MQQDLRERLDALCVHLSRIGAAAHWLREVGDELHRLQKDNERMRKDNERMRKDNERVRKDACNQRHLKTSAKTVEEILDEATILHEQRKRKHAAP